MLSRSDHKRLMSIPKKSMYNMIIPQRNDNTTLSSTISIEVNNNVLNKLTKDEIDFMKELEPLEKTFKECYNEDLPNRIVIISVPERLLFEQLVNDDTFILLNSNMLGRDFSKEVYPVVIKDAEWNELTTEEKFDNDSMITTMKIYALITMYELSNKVYDLKDIDKHPYEAVYKSLEENIMGSSYMFSKKEYDVYQYKVIISEYEKLDLPPINMEELNNGDKTCE